jgi:hypothetical protein
MVQTLAGIALLQFTEVKAGTKVFAFTVDDCRTHRAGHVVEQVTQGQDQRVVERVAFGFAGQPDDRDFLVFALQLKVNNVFVCHCLGPILGKI